MTTSEVTSLLTRISHQVAVLRCFLPPAPQNPGTEAESLAKLQLFPDFPSSDWEGGSGYKGYHSEETGSAGLRNLIREKRLQAVPHPYSLLGFESRKCSQPPVACLSAQGIMHC